MSNQTLVLYKPYAVERGLVRQGRLFSLRVKLPDRAGELARLTGLVAEAGANVNEMRHDRRFSAAALAEVWVELTLETRGPEHVTELLATIRGGGFEVHASLPIAAGAAAPAGGRAS